MLEALIQIRTERWVVMVVDASVLPRSSPARAVLPGHLACVAGWKWAGCAPGADAQNDASVWPAKRPA